MKIDMRESMMLLANKDLGEYELLKKISVEDFISKYKLFIEDITKK